MNLILAIALSLVTEAASSLEAAIFKEPASRLMGAKIDPEAKEFLAVTGRLRLIDCADLATEKFGLSSLTLAAEIGFAQAVKFLSFMQRAAEADICPPQKEQITRLVSSLSKRFDDDTKKAIGTYNSKSNRSGCSAFQLDNNHFRNLPNKDTNIFDLAGLINRPLIQDEIKKLTDVGALCSSWSVLSSYPDDDRLANIILDILKYSATLDSSMLYFMSLKEEEMFHKAVSKPFLSQADHLSLGQLCGLVDTKANQAAVAELIHESGIESAIPIFEELVACKQIASVVGGILRPLMDAVNAIPPVILCRKLSACDPSQKDAAKTDLVDKLTAILSKHVNAESVKNRSGMQQSAPEILSQAAPVTAPQGQKPFQSSAFIPHQLPAPLQRQDTTPPPAPQIYSATPGQQQTIASQIQSPESWSQISSSAALLNRQPVQSLVYIPHQLPSRQQGLVPTQPPAPQPSSDTSARPAAHPGQFQPLSTLPMAPQTSPSYNLMSQSLGSAALSGPTQELYGAQAGSGFQAMSTLPEPNPYLRSNPAITSSSPPAITHSDSIAKNSQAAEQIPPALRSIVRAEAPTETSLAVYLLAFLVILVLAGGLFVTYTFK